MLIDTGNLALKLVELCHGYIAAIDTVMALSRALRAVAFTNADTDQAESKHPFYWTLNFSDVEQEFHKELGSVESLNILLEYLRTVRLSANAGSGEERFSRSVFQPIALVRHLLENVRPDHELRYFVMKNLRKRWNRILSAETAHEFQILSNLLSSAIKIRASSDRNQLGDDTDQSIALISLWEEMRKRYASHLEPYYSGKSQSWDYFDILSILSLSEKSDRQRDWKCAKQAFLECCFAVNYLQAHSTKNRWVVLRTNAVDSAFLLSNMFGMKTSITGFDNLFGGGGLIIADGHVAEAHRHGSEPGMESVKRIIGGRAVLTIGRYGTGKSLLCMQFAVEVARKGGLAYVMTVEQSPDECLYALGSLCGLPPRELVDIAKDSASARRVLRHPQEGKGAIVLINPLKNSFKDFAVTFQNDLQAMEQYPLRIVIVDAISAIPRDADRKKVRLETLELLHKAKYSGTNIWLVAEEGGGRDIGISDALLEYENISDTVVRLSSEQVLSYAQRYFEITKSRFQREQRGKHPFSISPGLGFTIFPSAAAVSSRIQPRSIRPPDIPIQFGLPALNDILGKDSLFSGDVIVLQGPAGTLKTPLGLLFLLGMDKPTGGGLAEHKRVESLVVSAGDDPSTIRQLLPGKLTLEQSRIPKRLRDIRICALNGGYIKPGYVLHSIEEELLRGRMGRRLIDRVMVDGVTHWGLSCPFMQEELTFGDTLVDLLRRHQVTSLFTCNDIGDVKSSALQQSIVDNADCVIQFQRVEFRGVYHVIFRVLKTRGMKHRRETFEMVLESNKLDVKVNSPLLRVTPDGKVEPLKIRLFFHHRNPAQREQNDRYVNALRSIVSPEVIVDAKAQDSGNLVNAWSLGSASALDELQITQIDEFQLPILHSQNSSSGSAPVHIFRRDQWSAEWDDMLPRLKKRIQLKKGNFMAVPMYDNIGLLASRGIGQIQFPEKTPSWMELATLGEKWEESNPDPNTLFFDFSTASEENYNCLFLEILSCVASPPKERCRLQDYLRTEFAIQAGKIYRSLCRRTHLLQKRTAASSNEKLRVNSNARVWRLWYSELNQWLSSTGNVEKDEIHVSALPHSLSVAGEWYLTVPSYSAAPDVGLRIIKLLTSHDAELARLRAGIGLPISSSFYRSSNPNSSFSGGISPYFVMDTNILKETVDHTIPRSHFMHYRQLAGILTFHLRKIIELPDDENDKVEQAIGSIFDNFCYQADFISAKA